MNRHVPSLRNKLAIIAVVVAGPTTMAASPISAARAATGTPPQLVCPPGNTDAIYCTDYCPGATLVGDQCVVVPASSVVSDPRSHRHRVRHSSR